MKTASNLHDLARISARSRRKGPRLQRDIVVVGGSAGAIEALRVIFAGLPADLPASIFVVVHTSAEFPSVLDKVLSAAGPIPAQNASDGERIRHGRIFVAPPDHHLTIEDGRVRVLRGPRENRHRPAVDPLFRTAAREYGTRVIGIVLSGLLDDGSAGLYAVRMRGGVTVVQEPQDSMWDQMPRNAIRYASPQHVWRTNDIAGNLVRLVEKDKGSSPVLKENRNHKPNRKKKRAPSPVKDELKSVEGNSDTAYPSESEGSPSVFACPECHGVLWELRDEGMIRFRCRVGHSYGPESLTHELSVASEAALWAAVRALEEKSAIGRRVVENWGHAPQSVNRLLEQSIADADNARKIRDMIFRGEAEAEDQKPLKNKAS